MTPDEPGRAGGRCTDAMGSESFHPRCHLEVGHDGPHERSHADWLEDRVAFLEDGRDCYHHDLIRVMGERNDAHARIDHALAVQPLDDAADFAAGYNEALSDLRRILSNDPWPAATSLPVVMRDISVASPDPHVCDGRCNIDCTKAAPVVGERKEKP